MFSKTCATAPWTPAAARVFLALLFVVAGFGKLTGFDATVGYVGSLTNESIAPVLTVLAIIFELGGGLMLLANWKAGLAIDMLIAFTVVATILGHTTFTGDAMKDQMQYTMILKNLAIIGGLLLMARLTCAESSATTNEAA
ncbi:MAG: DoxX family protein [Candidatus Moraniibacteriota bacterium]|nr:MAG: DoxX family protein [Candidatus Moranbacteria bacterium]